MAEYRRFFASIGDSLVDGKIYLKSEYNHIVRVLRLAVGTEVFVCFNDSFEHFCEIETIESESVVLKVLDSKKSETENEFFSTFYIGVLKGDKNEFVVQKAVELGVNRVVFFDSTFVVAKWKDIDKKLDRMNKISIEASKQCGRAVAVPVDYLSFKDLKQDIAKKENVLLCYEKENKATLASTINVDAKDISIIVGAEGGFSETEVDDLVSCGAKSVSLGKRILRAETAPIVAIALSTYILGEK